MSGIELGDLSTYFFLLMSTFIGGRYTFSGDWAKNPDYSQPKYLL